MLEIAHSWSIKNFMEFNAKKSECLVVHNSRIPKKNRDNLKFHLGKNELKIIEQYKYLGVIVSQKGDFNFKSRCYKSFLKKSMEKVRARLARVRTLGFHKDGLRPETAVRLYKSLIRPILEFMGSVIELPENQINVLERFQNECLRSFLGLPVSTHGSLLRLISGVEPLGARFDILKIGYYSRISSKFDKNRAVYSLVSKDFERFNFGDILGGVQGSFAGSIHRIFSKLDRPDKFEFLIISTTNTTNLKIKIWSLYHKKDISRIYSSKQSQLFYSLYKNQTVGRVRSNRNPYQILPIGTSMFLGEERPKRSILLKNHIWCWIFE